MTAIPASHIADSHKLVADGRVDLFTLTPPAGGTVRFKQDNDQIWQGNLFTGIPMQLTGERRTADAGFIMPKLQIGQENVDLSMFKALVYDGYLDNATVIRQTVLLTNIIANQPIFEQMVYRIKRVEQYSRSQIVLALATLSDSLGFELPYRQYLPPAFPSVRL